MIAGTTLPTAEDLKAVREALDPVALRTPLLATPVLANRVGVPVFLKPEYLQPVGAFKIRGAFTAMAHLPTEALRRGVVTHSSGNHGQAVAMAARHFGIRAVVVMPSRAPAVKVEGVRRHGAEIVFVEHPQTERVSRTQAIIAEEGLTFIAPYDDPHVILGQATVGAEILEDAPVDLSAIVSPVGGGGLLAGLATAVQVHGRAVSLVGAEPRGAASLQAALRAGHPVTLDRTESVADGLLARSVGALPFERLRSVSCRSEPVSDSEIVEAVVFLYRNLGLRVEPSGAAGVAAVLTGRWTPPGPVAIVVSGGNVDPLHFRALVNS